MQLLKDLYVVVSMGGEVFADSMNTRSLWRYFKLPDPDWVAGAVAGLRVVDRSTRQGWEWKSFLQDVEDMVELLGEVKPIWPGETPENGSLLDALGGFISVAGKVLSGELYFDIELKYREDVMMILSSLKPQNHRLGLLLSDTDELRASALLQLKGPLADRLST